MSYSKRGFFYCIWFSLFVLVPCAASFAQPDQGGGPPSPPGQGMHKEEPSFKKDPPPPPPPPKDQDNILNYRGNRMYSMDLPLLINSVSCSKNEDESINIMIFFNQSVNPRSVSSKSFLINGEEISSDIRFSFNKKGDTIKMDIPECDEEFKIKVQNIAAFNGVKIEPVEITAKVED